ncbi:MAG: carboxypeptidase regulatory-like domain-containing protein, partial [Propionibacteriaceae bacterium]|nr:carboxypeptidase regulatory-like domain-containing protein [Propionibacteriaceae bacterium]
SVVTDSEGYYEITGLPAVRIQVRATRAGYLDAWASGVGSRADATVYRLRPGETLEQTWDEQRVLYLDLTPEGVVTGTVVGVRDVPAPGSRTAVGGARVTVVSASTGTRLGSAVTSADGSFRVGMLPSGEVRVKAAARGWLTGWAPNSPIGEVQEFSVRAGQTTDIGPVALYAPATVRGAVTSLGKAIHGRARVRVLDADTSTVLASVLTRPHGSFRIGGLSPGDVVLQASRKGYRTQTSATITLHAGEVVEPRPSRGVVLDLLPSTSLVGTLMGFSQDPGNGWDDPLAGVRVTVVSARTGRVLGSAITNALGDFAVGPLPPVRVKVRAHLAGWLTTWAPDQPSRDLATVYRIRRGEVTDVGTVALYKPAAIEGQVLSSMDPIGYATVTVFDAATHRKVGSAVSDGDGRYRVEGMWPGQVKVRASLAHYIPNWADSFGQRDWDTATTFQLYPGWTLTQAWSPTASLYLDIAREAVITGSVWSVPFGTASMPVGDATVTVFEAGTGKVLGETMTDGMGRYTVGMLPAVGVKIRAAKDGWVTSWAIGKTSETTADVFTLYPGQTLSQTWDWSLAPVGFDPCDYLPCPPG